MEYSKVTSNVEKKVLIIDDDEEIRESLKLRFEIAGFFPLVVDNGARAIELVKENDFLLVLSDIAMPRMSGYDVFKAIKDVKPALPVILMTAFGYDPEHTIIKARQLGLYKWVQKPIKDQTLKEIYNTAMMFYRMRKNKGGATDINLQHD